jgi:SpoVK/Ycf46/Vps4 family AAA+-type ATPase
MQLKVLLPIVGLVGACLVVLIGGGAGLWSTFTAAVGSNLMLQTLIGTYIASTAAGVSRTAMSYAFLWARDVFMTSVTVPNTEAFLVDAVRRYMSTHASKVLWKQSKAMVPLPEALSWKERFKAMVHGLSTKRAASFVKLAPITTTVTFPLKYQNTWTLFAASDSGVVVSVVGRNREAFLQQLLQHISDTEADTRPVVTTSNAIVYVATFDSTTKVWRWARSYDLPPRNASSLILDGDVMETLLDDARTFFTSSDAYLKQQQPYRRGWLLHGPPGTGKSTTAMVVATELDLPVYVLQLGNSEMDDSSLNSLLTTAPVPALILLEDIDAACGASKSRFQPVSSSSENGPLTLADLFKTSKLTLAGLLNALDGVGAHQGHIVIMTTNDLAALDPALIREGRCDVHAKLSFASADQIRRLFLAQFPDATSEQIQDFCDAVPDQKYSPAKIAAYLRKRSYSVVKALEDCADNFCSFNMTDITFQFRQCNTYDLLWSHGMEFRFAETVCEDNLQLTIRLGPIAPIFYNPKRINLMVPSSPASARDAQGYFLSAFPNATVAQRNTFGRIVDTFNATHPVKMTHSRIIQYLYVNADSVELALRDVDKWLLQYGRRPGGNIVRKFTMFHMLRLRESSMVNIMHAMKEALRWRVTTFEQIISRVSATSILYPIGTQAGLLNKVATRMDIAALMEDAFGCDTAFRFARDLCDDEGRCWSLSVVNLRSVLGMPCSVGPEEYVAALRAYAAETMTMRDEDIFARLQEELDEEARAVEAARQRKKLAEQAEQADRAEQAKRAK